MKLLPTIIQIVIYVILIFAFEMVFDLMTGGSEIKYQRTIIIILVVLLGPSVQNRFSKTNQATLTWFGKKIF